MKKTLLIGFAFVLGVYAASYIDVLAPQSDAPPAAATAQVASR